MNAVLYLRMLFLLALMFVGGCGDDAVQTQKVEAVNKVPQENASSIEEAFEYKILGLDHDLNSQLEVANAYVQECADTGRPYAVRSYVYEKLGRIPEQLADLNAAIPLLSKNSRNNALLMQSFFARGLMSARAEDHGAAVTDYKKGIDADGSNPNLIQACAFSHLQLGMMAEAEAYVELAIMIDPQDEVGFQMLAFIRSQMTSDSNAQPDEQNPPSAE